MQTYNINIIYYALALQLWDRWEETIPSTMYLLARIVGIYQAVVRWWPGLQDFYLSK
jgi:hypothetical protein